MATTTGFCITTDEIIMISRSRAVVIRLQLIIRFDLSLLQLHQDVVQANTSTNTAKTKLPMLVCSKQF